MSVKILLRFNYRNHLDQVNEYTIEFVSIPNLSNYFRWEPERAMMLGYGEVDEERVRNSRTSNVRLILLANDKEIEFKDVHKFTSYIRQHPAIAQAVQLP